MRCRCLLVFDKRSLKRQYSNFHIVLFVLPPSLMPYTLRTGRGDTFYNLSRISFVGSKPKDSYSGRPKSLACSDTA